MAITWEDLGDGADLENQTNYRFSFKNEGGGTGSSVPIDYVEEGERLAVCKNLAAVLEPYCAYKVNMIHTMVSSNISTPVPEDPGAEVPGATWYGYVKKTGDPVRHKVNFRLPGAKFSINESGQVLGDLIADTLTNGSTASVYHFKYWT